MLRRILREVRPYRWRLVLVFGLSLLATPLVLLQPIPLRVLIDSVLGPDQLPGWLGTLFPRSAAGYGVWLLIAAIALQLVTIFLTHVQSILHTFLQSQLGERISLGLRGKLLNRAQRLSFAFHDKRGTHDSIYRIQYDASAIQHVAVHSLISFASSMLMLIAMAVVMLSINLHLALIGMAIVPFLFVYTRWYGRRMKPQYKEAKKLESSALGVVQEVLTSFRVVKAFGREDHEEERFVDSSRRGVRARIRLSLAEGLFGLLVGMTAAVGTAAVLFVGVGQVQAGAITLGELLMVLSYLGMLYGPVKTISKRVAGLQNHLASAERAFELLDEIPGVVDRPNARPLARALGAVEFRDVSFGYEGDIRVLEGVSFSAAPGSCVGIVGRTGAGKTTLVSLLTRFYDPTGGSIRLDGEDIESYRLADVRKQFSIVLQEPILFSTTVADNIAYAMPDASEDQIIAAAKAAGAHDFITEMPEGYDTVVGERGMRLSGGERQRISLARAFLKDAPILILDEPTSSVDTTTEAAIMETMRELMHGRTTFMIAHRLSTLHGCDWLLELEGGRVRLQTQQVTRARGTASEIAGA